MVDPLYPTNRSRFVVQGWVQSTKFMLLEPVPKMALSDL